MATPKRRFLITGASGQLGSYLVRELQRQELPFVAWSRSPKTTVLGADCHGVDIRDRDAVHAAFAAADPGIIIHAAAMSGVNECFQDSAGARQTNTNGTRFLSDLAAEHAVRMLYVSTDLVFDGRHGFYRETDCPTPLSVYGHTKAAAERAVLDHPHQLVARVSLLFGPPLHQRPSFFAEQIQAIQAGRPVTLFEDEWRTPISLQVAAQGLILAARSAMNGILHLGGPERMSRWEMGQRLARLLGEGRADLRAASRDDFPATEPRPRDTSLNSDLWQMTFPDFSRPAYEQALTDMGVLA
jgi:dTDP-4-dehydrorhamnose reductase